METSIIGCYQHCVPQVMGHVVRMRDGTEVWRRDNHAFAFANVDSGALRVTERCVLLSDADIDRIPEEYPFAFDLSSVEGLVLLGLARGENLATVFSCNAEDAPEILWDSEDVLTKHRTLGRVVVVEEDAAWCTFAIPGAGVLLRLPPDLVQGRAAPDFRFCCKIENPRFPECVRHDAYEDLGFSDFELDHDQRVPTLDELMERRSDLVPKE